MNRNSAAMFIHFTIKLHHFDRALSSPWISFWIFSLSAE